MTRAAALTRRILAALEQTALAARRPLGREERIPLPVGRPERPHVKRPAPTPARRG